ncbi:TlpA family protein disulfide reductase [Rhizohabitans arisaemae]|uniref:TlpA family protein disulfide reductase n=1 Tax=Rhizohabitans arisaemae TaxID=2720610 RepID=UPI0024B0F19B|nr:TlpA disulfide reductase family protein [Rhizohabitans arisaemae]
MGAAVAAAAVLLLGGCAGNSGTQTGPGTDDTRFIGGTGQVQKFTERKPAPAVEGTTLADKPFKLSDLRGKVVVMNFWASWCAPCRSEAPALKQVYDETKARGVEFVGVDFKDQKESAKAFERTYKIEYPSLFDQPGRVALAFQGLVSPNAIPSTLIIDRQGKIAVRITGEAAYSRLKAVVDELAAER